MTAVEEPPGTDDLEITLFGPGYGESIVVHIGNGAWIVVDSCIEAEGMPAALPYLRGIGVDPATAVALVVATHWHDDHIRGMARLVAACQNARFSCAAALCREEFLAAVGTLEGRSTSRAGSGLREIRDVLTQLGSRASVPAFASANRRILRRDTCEVWSLSPADAVIQDFLASIAALLPGRGQARTRVPSLSPNQVAVALWIQVDDIAVLLGSDLDRPGWIHILQSEERPSGGGASAFKVPHHGAENADEPDVWNRMLGSEPLAVLTPWRRGGRTLPRSTDVRRIRLRTPHGYVTAAGHPARRSRPGMVDRTLRESGATLRRVATASGAIRLRRSVGKGTAWSVELMGTACSLDTWQRDIAGMQPRSG